MLAGGLQLQDPQCRCGCIPAKALYRCGGSVISARKMPRRPANPSPDARMILDELFAHPPVSRAELEQRLDRSSPVELRRLLIDRIVRGRLRESDSDLMVSLFHIVGVGRDCDVLIDAVADARRERHVRACALAVLLAADPTYSERLRKVVPPDDLLSLVAEPLAQFIFHAEANPDDGDALVSALESVPAEMLQPLFQQLEHRRRSGGVPAAVAYERVLRRPDLSVLHAEILNALSEEGGRDALQLMEALRAQASDAAQHRQLQGMLMRLHTRTMEGRTRLPGLTSAHISSCDGQSTFFILADRSNLDGTHTLALLCISAQHGVRDGHIATRQTNAQAEYLLSRFMAEAGVEFVRVRIDQANALVQRTLREHPDIPEEVKPVLRFFGRSDAAPLPLIAKATRATLAQLRTQMQRRPYDKTWFVDGADMASLPQPPPLRRQPSVAWYTQAAAALAQRGGLCDRLVAMASHMAIWHQLRGEAAAAGLCMAAAESTRQAPADSSLLRVLLERSVIMARSALTAEGESADPGPGVLLGDPLRRQYIKSRFFVEVEAPHGRDLALLDFTEAALLSLERAVGMLPGDMRPREEEVQQAAHALAGLFRDYILHKEPRDAAVLSDRMTTVLTTMCRPHKAPAEVLARSVLSALVAFVDQVCGSCKVACLHRPRAFVGPSFFATAHPAGERVLPAAALAGERGPRRRRATDAAEPNHAGENFLRRER